MRLRLIVLCIGFLLTINSKGQLYPTTNLIKLGEVTEQSYSLVNPLYITLSVYENNKFLNFFEADHTYSRPFDMNSFYNTPPSAIYHTLKYDRPAFEKDIVKLKESIQQEINRRNNLTATGIWLDKIVDIANSVFPNTQWLKNIKTAKDNGKRIYEKGKFLAEMANDLQSGKSLDAIITDWGVSKVKDYLLDKGITIISGNNEVIKPVIEGIISFSEIDWGKWTENDIQVFLNAYNYFAGMYQQNINENIVITYAGNFAPVIDYDNDGILNRQDWCDRVKGTPEYHGCDKAGYKEHIRLQKKSERNAHRYQLKQNDESKKYYFSLSFSAIKDSAGFLEISNISNSYKILSGAIGYQFLKGVYINASISQIRSPAEGNVPFTQLLYGPGLLFSPFHGRISPFIDFKYLLGGYNEEAGVKFGIRNYHLAGGLMLRTAKNIKLNISAVNNLFENKNVKQKASGAGLNVGLHIQL